MITDHRASVREFVERPGFQQAIIAVIMLNAVTLGLETSQSMVAGIGGLLHVIDRTVVVIFVAELALRLYGYGWRFFRDPWNLFDFAIVGIALLPVTGEFAVLRALRILRALRLISVVPSMRRVVGGLLAAMPGMASIAALLSLILYVAAVIGTKLFWQIAPEHFGTLARTLFTLFQTMTGEGWPDVARAVMAEAPLAWIFFVVYILVSSFMVLNLFIAVVVSAMEGQVMAETRAEEAAHAAEEQVANRQILAEVQALRAELADLKARV
ncbi:ion transporter [Pseudonocardia spinosispora]|uniref:ion transporter n=1 Tax=Pseudonocardia spinosispora TaxID=103441 RepID=UPI00041C9EC5|nr:ion transporter [Pseudonocardia spinosispora]